MKRRAAVEPTIGHLKSNYRLERNRLNGYLGDAINVLFSAAVMNFKKLLGFFLAFFVERQSNVDIIDNQKSTPESVI